MGCYEFHLPGSKGRKRKPPKPSVDSLGGSLLSPKLVGDSVTGTVPFLIYQRFPIAHPNFRVSKYLRQLAIF